MLLTQNQKVAIESALSEKYGTKGEDFDLTFVKYKSKEYAFAVKVASRLTFSHWKKQNEQKNTDTFKNEYNFVLDCLITDVDGVEGLESFKKIAEERALLQTKLGNMIIEMMTSGVDIKKD